MAVSRRGETVACDEEGEGMRRRKKKDIWVFARGLMVGIWNSYLQFVHESQTSSEFRHE